MEAETYALSRLYLSRFRMYRVMRDIIDADKEESGIETPSVERTPEWYVQGYLKYQCNSETESHRRLIHDSSDSEIEAGQDGLLAGNKHHKLRHICAAEVRSLFAMHAKWMVKDQREQLHSKKRLINVDLWEAWLRNVDSWREQAARKGLTFGVFPEGDEIQPTPEADSSDPDDYTPQAPVSRSSTKRRKLNQPYTLRSTVSSEGQHAYTGRSTRLHPTLTSEPIIVESSSDELSYDSEFSEHSQASDPPSSDSDDSPPPSPPSPTLLAQIPPELMRPLELPAFGFTWYCPVARCHYKVDLLNPTEENCRGIEAVDVHELKHGKWSMSTPQVQLIFERMVSVHYGDHLSRSGIIVSETGTSITLKLKTTAAQPPTEPIVPARAGGIFKEEDRD
ncbi:hypothetical protein PHLCEN_2v447 [Hermanssonia centrifuga]|uniref:Uncharacterized protein n=1 Tax=Hermanssonia centrifuga TaxID=98765 RepID=A0A2R6S637_9APHY|nr:hypothetical protein PHLCEN_2v447 [Hermanssonia centrifuga]